jgi:hypothetical protein
VTVIVGLVHDGRVLLGGDSAGVSGYDLTIRTDPKVFTTGAYVLGFTTSFRMGQLLRWSLQPPAPPEAGDLDRFLCTTWVDAVRDCLKLGGWAKKDNEQETGGKFLVGVTGRLFVVDSDYQIGEPADGYAACGCGEDVALGALAATAGIDDPEERVRLALAAAERHNAGVRGPFRLVWSEAA